MADLNGSPLKETIVWGIAHDDGLLCPQAHLSGTASFRPMYKTQERATRAAFAFTIGEPGALCDAGAHHVLEFRATPVQVDLSWAVAHEDGTRCPRMTLRGDARITDNRVQWMNGLAPELSACGGAKHVRVPSVR